MTNLFPFRVLLIITAVILSAFICNAQAQGEVRGEDAEYFQGLKWRSIGPFRGGRVTAVAGHVDNPLFYVMGATGGVFITRNGGQSWVPVSDKDFTTASVGAVDIAESNSDIIVVGMGEACVRGVASSHGDGVYRSTDGGKTWTHLGLEDTRHISTVKIHPDDPQTFWVAAQGAAYAPTKDRGVYKTTDGGKSFTRVLYVDENTGAVDLQVDPNDPMILYAAMWDWGRKPWLIRSGGSGSAVYKSVDGGETWKEIGGGFFPDHKGKIGIAASAARPGRVFALIEASEKGGVYRSDDYGESWQHLNNSRDVQARSWYYMHIFADPKDENSVYVLNGPFLKSVNGGETFEQQRGSYHSDHHELWINPENPAIMIDANDGGATVTFDAGKTWTTQYNQATGQFYRVNVDNDYFYRVYGAQQDNTTVAVNSFGQDGTIGRDDVMVGVGGCESGQISFDPDNPRYIYATCPLGIISEFDMQTQTDRDVMAYPELGFGVEHRQRKYRFNWNSPVHVSRHDPAVIYHGSNILLKSTDRGVSWKEISPDLTRDESERQGKGGIPFTNESTDPYNTILYIAESPHSADTIWVGTDDGLVQLSRDEGKNWKNVTPPGAGNGQVNAIEVSPHDPATAYVAFTRFKYNDNTPLIYKTSNYGQTWDNIAGNIPAGSWVRVVREDPEYANLLFAGTELGLYASFDAGLQWQRLKSDATPMVPVTDLRVHQGNLVLSTQGRGFWIIDDISPLQQMSKGVSKFSTHFFVPKKASDIRLHNMWSWAGPGKNPAAGAVIYYNIGEGVDLAETSVSLDVFDSEGRLVRTLQGKAGADSENGLIQQPSQGDFEVQKGINRLVWDLRNEPISHTGVDDFAITSLRNAGNGLIPGHHVGPGTYSVHLSVGDKVFRQALTVEGDPRLEVEPSVQAEQQQRANEIRAMLVQFQQSVIDLRQFQAQARQGRVSAELRGNQDLAKLEQASVDAVNIWESDFISTQRDTYQDILNFPDLLYSKLQFLYQLFNGQNYLQRGSQPMITQGSRERFNDVKREFDKAMLAHDVILKGTVWN
jgi:photosystem II stability/assembly factor-like uncharacterized protein